jgi:flagellar hook protein FlgE
MGIFDALTTAVTGLQAQAFALQNISGNIANSQTTGYKETDTNFEDLVAAATVGQQTSGGVIASSVSTNTVQGAIQSTTVSTDMAINGSGFFVVAQPTGIADNQPTFNSVNDYTRAGNFQMNSSGYLVNGAGYYLMGIPVDPTTGNPVGSSPQVLQFDNNFVPAQETTEIQYQANLPSSPTAGVLNPSGYEANPLAGVATNATITGTDAALEPDSQAVGTVGSLTSSTALVDNDTYTVNDGTNTTSFTAGAASTLGDLISYINSNAGTAGFANVTAALSNGKLVFTSNADAAATVTVGGTGAAAVGFGSGNTSFDLTTNLLTQNAVAQNQTLTVTVGGGSTQTITFGTGSGQVATLEQLQTALSGLTGVSNATVDAEGDISLSATSPTASLTIGGTASATKFGIGNLSALPDNGTVIGNDVSTFTNQSTDGGAITTYDSEGNPVNVEFRWAQTSSASGANSWQLFYQTNSSATGTQAAWQNVGTTFTFNANGELNPPISSLTVQNLTVNGDSLGNVQLQFGTNGLSQFAESSGTAQVNQLQQNGYAAGQLQSVSVDGQNRIVGTFSNGQTIPLAEITLATFNGANALQSINGAAFQATAGSGPPLYDATGTIVGSSLEASNVDIATQFSQLIVAQQAYSANARVMSTADQMIQSLLQVIQ